MIFFPLQIPGKKMKKDEMKKNEKKNKLKNERKKKRKKERKKERKEEIQRKIIKKENLEANKQLNGRKKKIIMCYNYVISATVCLAQGIKRITEKHITKLIHLF